MLGPPKLRCLDRPVAVSLEALVPPDDFYRHLDAKLDLGFVRDVVHDRYADGGRPSIDPVVFFKLQLVLFFEGIRSERQLIATASLHLAHRWYLGYHLDEPLPDHSSLTRIRERYGLAVFRRFFERVVELCQEAGLVWGKELFFDATKVRANAAVDSLRPRLHQVAREHLEELFAPDALEPAEPGAAPAAASAADSAKNAERPAAVTPTPLRPPDAHAARTAGTTGEPARWELLEQCRLDPDRPPVGSYRRTTDVRASTTDPDAAPMSNGGKIVLGYHDHCVVDGGRKRIILYALVTPADVMENRPMLDLLRRVRFRWRLRPKRAIGDTTYGTVQNIRALEDEGIRAYVPLPDFDQRTPFYGASRFTYDAERDAYRCPQGRPLRRWKAKHTEEVVIYRADAATCTACPVRAACTSSAHGRQVRRSFHAAYLERVKAYHGTPGYQKAMRKRKIWVEPLFGEAKEWHGLRRFRLRGLQKVNTEGLLIAAGQNLKRWLAATGWGRRHGPCGSLFPARTGDGARCRTRSRAARHRPVAGRPTPGFSTRSDDAGIWLEPLTVWALWLHEDAAPEGVEPLDWLLLTNVPIQTWQDATERIGWYCLRPLIESWHKILKSGCTIEDCRLETAERLKPYLTLMGIIAWRLFWLTHINRQMPEASCTTILADHEWKALYSAIHRRATFPATPPTVRQAVRWIAELGGFLARKGDGEPVSPPSGAGGFV